MQKYSLNGLRVITFIVQNTISGDTKVMKSIDDNIVLNCLVLYSDFVISNLSELLIWRCRNIYNMRMIGY